MQRIDFLANVSIKQFNEIYYGLRRKFFEKGNPILKEGDSIDCFYMVESGLLELRTEFDGNPFSMQRLPQGTIIN